VDPDLFHPGRRCEDWRAARGLSAGRPAIVFLGRLVMEKGLAVFVETVRRLQADGVRFRVLVIGDGPARLWFAAQLPDAEFTGFLSGEALATAVASGDIFFTPSVTETFGNVNLEAMASGLAMVCADAPNTRTLLRHGRSALLCPPDDAAGYAAAIRSLVDDPAARARMGRAAHAESAAYRWSEILDTVVDVYAEALAGGVGPPALNDAEPIARAS
jgi:glycosyltransferase involved in cell wall biosynthesis